MKEQIKSILWTLRWVIAILILFLGFMFVTKILLPGYNESVTDKSPIVSIKRRMTMITKGQMKLDQTILLLQQNIKTEKHQQ